VIVASQDVSGLIDQINDAFKKLIPPDVVQLPALGEEWVAAFSKLRHNLEWLVREYTLPWSPPSSEASFPGFLVKNDGAHDITLKPGQITVSQGPPQLIQRAVVAESGTVYYFGDHEFRAIPGDSPIQATYAIGTDAELKQQQAIDRTPDWAKKCDGHTRAVDPTWIRIDPRSATDKREVCAKCGVERAANA
jgi:hypothetical protein